MSRSFDHLRCRLVAGLLLFVLGAGASHRLGAQTIQTRCGTGVPESNGVQGPTTTNIGNPFGVECDAGGHLYICEVTNHRIWRQDRRTGELTVVAGTGQPGYAGDGGPATDAVLNEPYELRFDAQGNLFVVEMQNHVVRRIDAETGIISTIAGTGQPGFGGDGGPATDAQLFRPHSIALDNAGGLYIADIGNHRIRRVELTEGTIRTIAGDGQRRLPTDGQPAEGHPVLGPRALFITDRTLWVALREGHSLWSLDLDVGAWHHWAGTGEQGYGGDGGPAARATFNGPKGIAVDARRQRLYLVDTENQVIRQLDLRSRRIDTLAGIGPDARGYSGDNGPARQAQLNRPHGICVDPQGNVIIGDSENHRVRQVSVTP